MDNVRGHEGYNFASQTVSITEKGKILQAGVGVENLWELHCSISTLKTPTVLKQPEIK